MKLSLGKLSVDVPWSFGDRLRALVTPKAAAADMLTRVASASMEAFKGSSTSRRAMRFFNPGQRNPNEELSAGLPTLRGRSRHLAKNVPLATGAISTVITNVVGDGLVLKSKIDRKVLGMTEEQAVEWQLAVQREWELFAKHCDFGDRQNFDGFQALAFRSVLESGDAFVVRRRRDEPNRVYGLRLQLVEADRVVNPAGKPNSEILVDGVELDADGRAVAFHISKTFPHSFSLKRETKRYAIGGTATGMPLILHLGEQLRPGQVRGAPYLAPVIESLKQLGDYADAEMTAAVIAGMFTAFIEQEAGEDPDNPLIGGPDDVGVDPSSEIALGSGAVVGLGRGEKVSIANPGRPNPQFDAFVTAVCREIGVALNLPIEVLLKSFNSSYSASRAALEVAWQFFQMKRSWLAWNMCQPIYEWFLTEAVAAGRIAAPGYFADPVSREAWLGSVWIGPSRIQLDPLKEASANQLNIAMGTTTREQIIIENGKGNSFEEVHEALVKEQRRRDADGLVTPVPNTGFASADAKGAKPDVNADDDDKNADKTDKEDADAIFRAQVLAGLAERPQPVINVHPAHVHMDAPIVNISPPAVNIGGAKVDVHAHIPRRGKVEKTMTYDADGRINAMIEQEVDDVEK
jgi:lambda family phage portal protein